MGKAYIAAVLGAICVVFLSARLANADTVWVTQWRTNPLGKIYLFDAAGNKIGSETPPPLPAGGKQIDMTASGLWRMNTDKGPIFFELNSVGAFTKDNESGCATIRDNANRSAASSSLSNSDCQHHP